MGKESSARVCSFMVQKLEWILKGWRHLWQTKWILFSSSKLGVNAPEAATAAAVPVVVVVALLLLDMVRIGQVLLWFSVKSMFSLPSDK